MRDAQRTKAEHADKATPEALAAKKNERERRSEASASGKRAGRGVALVETGACVQFKTISQVAFSSSGVEVKLPFLPYQALNDRAQTKLGAFKQDFISQGDSKLKEVSRMLESYQESDWQKGLLLRADRDLNHAKECFNVACSVDEDRTEIKQYDDKLAVLETKLRTAQMESNVQTPR